MAQAGFWFLLGIIVAALGYWVVWRLQVLHERRRALCLLVLDLENKLSQRKEIEASGHAPPVLSKDAFQLALPHMPSIDVNVAHAILKMSQRIDAWNSAATVIGQHDITGVDAVRKRMKYRGRVWESVQESHTALESYLNQGEILRRLPGFRRRSRT